MVLLQVLLCLLLDCHSLYWRKQRQSRPPPAHQGRKPRALLLKPRPSQPFPMLERS